MITWSAGIDAYEANNYEGEHKVCALRSEQSGPDPVGANLVFALISIALRNEPYLSGYASRLKLWLPT